MNEQEIRAGARGVRASETGGTVILTTPEVAALLGLSPAGVRKLVERKRLRPVRGSARPLRFRWADVEALRTARMSAGEHDQLDELAAQWRASA